MANGFLLKDRSDRAQGYLLAGDKEICCRLSCPVGNAELSVCGGQEWFRFPLAQTDAEQQFPCSCASVTGAVIHAQGKLMMASDWMLENVLPKTKEPVSETVHAEKPEPDRQEEPKRSEQPQRSFPQRRWPPPPCLTGAHYISGRWQEESGDDAVCEGRASCGFAVPGIDV